MSADNDIRPYLSPSSAFHVPYAGSMKEFCIDNGSVLTNGVVNLENDNRLSWQNKGEYVVTNEFTVSGSGKKDGFAAYNAGVDASNVFKIEKATCAKTDGYTFWFAEGNGASHGTYYFGKGGINFGSGKGYFGIGKNADDDAQTIRPWYGDFTIKEGSGNSAGFDVYFVRNVTFNTDDENGIGRTITLNARPKFINTPTFTVAGSGTVLVNSVASNTVEPPVTVTDTATLAFGANGSLGTGAITLNAGTTLAVAESGTVTLGGDLTLKDGAALGFNYTTANAPVLNLTDKTVTFDEGAATNVVVKISSDDGVRPGSGRMVLTSGSKFADATPSLAEGAPAWVKRVGVEDGNIYVEVKPKGLMIMVY